MSFPEAVPHGIYEGPLDPRRCAAAVVPTEAAQSLFVQCRRRGKATWRGYPVCRQHLDKLEPPTQSRKEKRR